MVPETEKRRLQTSGFCDVGPAVKHLRVDDRSLLELEIKPGLFCDGTRRYGVPAPFFQVKKKQLFVMYIVNE